MIFGAQDMSTLEHVTWPKVANTCFWSILLRVEQWALTS
jgi:hypothetical protein